jgi:NTP pyrophosphatase (non-canonical NTP hydrolase)
VRKKVGDKVKGAAIFFQQEDININSDKDSNIDIDSDIDINNNIESNMDMDIDMKKNIKVNIKKNIKKTVKQKPVGYYTYLPSEYIEVLEAIKIETNYNKNELAEMAYKLLFKSMGVEIKK